MLSFSIGHSIDYLTDQVAEGREAYYTDAPAASEPAGVWTQDSAALGLVGEVDTDVIKALYGQFIDPRDGASVLGNRRRNYSTAEQLYERKLDATRARPPRNAN